jgi:hypothetical protein
LDDNFQRLINTVVTARNDFLHFAAQFVEFDAAFENGGNDFRAKQNPVGTPFLFLKPSGNQNDALFFHARPLFLY